MNDFLPIPHFSQSTDGYCLPTCARMVLAYMGLNHSEAQVSQVLGTQFWGTPSFAIERLTALNVEVTYREWTISDLFSRLATKQPLISFIRTGFLDYYQEDFAHAVVIVGGSHDQHFWIHDPDRPTGPLKVSWNGLLAAWAEFGYRGAVLLKK